MASAATMPILPSDAERRMRQHKAQSRAEHRRAEIQEGDLAVLAMTRKPPPSRSAICWVSVLSMPGIAWSALFILLILSRSVAVRAQLPTAVRSGTYEISWFSINTVTEQPTVAKAVVVLSSAAMPDSLGAAMISSRGLGSVVPRPTACWRIADGDAAMNVKSVKATSTDWRAIGDDSVAIQLWFDVDAGSELRFKLTGDSLRGRIRSSGWMKSTGGGASPRVVLDSVRGRRVGDADFRRCLH
jgi:hypothetical protein